MKFWWNTNLISLHHLIPIHYSSYSINAIPVSAKFITVKHLWTKHCLYLQRFLNMLHCTSLSLTQCHACNIMDTMQMHTVYNYCRIVWLTEKHITWCCYSHTVVKTHALVWESYNNISKTAANGIVCSVNWVPELAIWEFQCCSSLLTA